MSAYADDLTLILDGSESSLRHAVNVLNEFRVVSGLQLNMGKTICSWMGVTRHRGAPICQELNLKWLKIGEPLELLGVKILPDIQRTRDINYSGKLEEIEKAMSPWVQRSLTPLGRVILVKSLLLSKFVHVFAVIENPDNAYIRKLESLLFKFIWGKKDKIKRGIAKRQFLEGGIGAPDVESFANALKVAWIKRWLDPKESSWKLFVNEYLQVSDRLNIFQCNIGVLQIRRRHLPMFWDQALSAWAQILQSSGETDEIMTQVLFLNRNLNIESSFTNYQLRAMKALQITHVKHLYNFPSKKWFTALELKQKWSGLDIMTCNSLVSKIPSEWRSVQRCSEPASDAHITLERLFNVESTTKWAYIILVKPKLNETCSCERKWDAELGLAPDWRQITKYLTESTKNIDLRWLQFRILHRILPTRKMLKLFGMVEDDQCVFCKRAVETASHLFVHCPKVEAFWDEVWRAFKRGNRSYNNMELSPRKILFGVDSNKHYGLNLLLLLAKSFIWKQSKKGSDVTVRLFLIHLQTFFNVQVGVHRLNDKTEEFSTLWCATAKTIGVLSGRS